MEAQVMASIGTVVLQGGALAILAVYFLLINPRQQAEERKSREAIATAFQAMVVKLFDGFRDELRSEREQCKQDHVRLDDKLDNVIDMLRR